MARIELSNAGGGGGGGALTLTTTGTSGASTLVGTALNIPVYQGQLTLSTAGTSGASTLVGNTLTIPTYQGALTLTTTGSGAATLVGNTLNIPTPVATTPGGSNTDIQYNNSGAFGGSSNLQWDNANVRLNIGAPSSPTGRLNVKGNGTTTTVGLSVTNSSNTSVINSLDNGNVGFGQASPVGTVHIKAASNSVGSAIVIENPQVTPTGGSGSTIYATGNGQTTTGANNSEFNFIVAGPGSGSVTQGPIFGMRGLNFSRFSNERGAMFFYSGGGMTSPSGLDGAIVFGSYSTFIDFQTGNSLLSRLRIYANGEVGVGTGSTTPSARFQARGANTTAGVGAFLVEDGNSTPRTLNRIDNDGKITYWATNTAAGTTGAQTINRPSGTVNFAAAATTLVVTNSLCTTSSIVFATVRTNDATAVIKNVVPGAGSFTINLDAAATAETSVGFFIIN